MGRRLYRSRTDRVIFGVAGGLGRHFDIDPVIFRVAFVAFLFVSGVGLIAYLILAIATPVEEFNPSGPTQGGTGEGQQASGPATASGPGGSPPDYTARRGHGRNVLGLLLIGVGVFFLAMHLGWLEWWGWGWGSLWPLVLIGLGLFIILNRARRS